MLKLMTVVSFRRKPHSHQFSIEAVFDGLAMVIPPAIQMKKAVMPHLSRGVFPRIKNIIWCNNHQGDVNHITGDIHYVALGLSKCKTILTIHDLNFLNHPNPIARFILKTFWLKLPLKKVRFVTVISEATKRDLLLRIKFPEERVIVIPNYCNPIFKTSPKNFNKPKPRILQIGTKANKNVERLIESLNGINCHLVIVGKKNEAVKKRLVQNNIHCLWLEGLSTAELIEQYHLCDMLCFVSTVEGFGMPILEAQAVGRVVVTSNVSSMPEVAGDAACFVDPFDVSSIREGILKVIEDDDFRTSLILRGGENVKRFDLVNVASMYCELYKELNSSTEG